MPDAAPDASRRIAQIDRPRLLARMQRRFEVRLTTLVGGGGSGKTTLLTQAMTAEASNIDVWHPCSQADRSPDHMRSGVLEALQRALGAEGTGQTDPIDEICDLVLGESPAQVCFVLDDGHLIGAPIVIDELLKRLPSNGHVAVASRGRIAIDTARLDAGGELQQIDQADLLLSSDELITFANLRGVDVTRLTDAHGWPAFVELATRSTGSAPTDYLRQEALESLDPLRRRQLSAFAFVGGGDDAVARSVAGVGLDQLMAHLPLVRWSGDSAQLHDLWGELLGDQLDGEQRAVAATAAANVARARNDFDRAIELCARVEAFDELLVTLEQAVAAGAEGGLRLFQLSHWHSAVPEHQRDSPIAELLAGLIEREHDPTSARAAVLLQSAADGFRQTNNAELELVALAQLGYVARISGEPARIESVMEQIAELGKRFAPAEPFVLMCEAWIALATGRPDRQLAALERIDPAQLPELWRATREHLIAHALFNLGRPHEALEAVPHDIEQRRLAIPGALVTEMQCMWYAGQPDAALRKLPDGLGAEYGARDQFVTNAWLALGHAYSGDVASARRFIALAEQHAGRSPGSLVGAQLVGVRLLIDIAEGREDVAAAGLQEILGHMPLEAGVSEQMLRNTIALPYVLVPSSRPFWHGRDFGPAIDRARELSSAFAAARETGDVSAIASMVWPDPGFAAAALPVRWAVEFALYGHLAGRYEAQHLLDWLSEKWGRPARATLAARLDDERLGDAARTLLASTPVPPEQPVAVRLLGETSLQVNHTESPNPNWRRERVRSVLTWLALNQVGNRARLASTLWPDLEPERAAKNLRTTLNYLHGVLDPRRSGRDASWFVRTDGQQIVLHHSLDVDLWRFGRLMDDADTAERRGRPTEALPLLVEACGLWRGDIAADLDHEWLELERIHVRGRFVRGACRAAELLVATGRPAEAVEVVRPAVEVDPWNDRGYEALAAGYRAMGDLTSARAVDARAAERRSGLFDD